MKNVRFYSYSYNEAKTYFVTFCIENIVTII